MRILKVTTKTIFNDTETDPKAAFVGFRQACSDGLPFEPTFDDETFQEFMEVIAQDLTLKFAHQAGFPRNDFAVIGENTSGFDVWELKELAKSKLREHFFGPLRLYARVLWFGFRRGFNWTVNREPDPIPFCYRSNTAFYWFQPIRQPFDPVNLDTTIVVRVKNGQPVSQGLHYFGRASTDDKEENLHRENQIHYVMKTHARSYQADAERKGQSLDPGTQSYLVGLTKPWDFAYFHDKQLPDDLKPEDLPRLCTEENKKCLHWGPKMEKAWHRMAGNLQEHYPDKILWDNARENQSEFPLWSELIDSPTEGGQAVLESLVEAVTKKLDQCKDIRAVRNYLKKVVWRDAYRIVENETELRRVKSYNRLNKIQVDEPIEDEADSYKGAFEELPSEKSYLFLAPVDLRQTLEKDPRKLIIFANWLKPTQEIHNILKSRGHDHGLRTTQRLCRELEESLEKAEAEARFWPSFIAQQIRDIQGGLKKSSGLHASVRHDTKPGKVRPIPIIEPKKNIMQ